MKKILNKKLASPSKLVGKVFHRQKSSNVDSQMSEEHSLIKEVESLREQVENLKSSLDGLKLDGENKDVQLAKLAREKEKLSLNLARVKRSNENLSQQLEDERNFYYKEKETYCQEMNEYKKLKKAISNSTLPETGEVAKLKKTLEQTLQTNYNLSVKFLRMKETKNQLSRSLTRMEEEHQRVVNDLKTKIEKLTSEMKEILNQKFDAPLSPSNKKYLQLVNQNSSLVYENLYLQMQVDQLNLKHRRNKIQKTKSDTTHLNKKSAREERVIKIFEREKKPSVPTVTILNEKEVTLKLSERKLQLPRMDESKLEVFQVSELQSRNSVTELSARKRSRSAPK